MAAVLENRMNITEKRKEQIRRYELSIGSTNDAQSPHSQQSDVAEKRHPTGQKSKIRFPDGCIFLAACTSGSTEDVEEILRTSNTDINTTNIDGLTGLHQACINEDLEMAKFLIDRKININIKDNEGWTALHAAAQSGFIDIAKLLIEKGAKLDVVNCDCELPIDLAENKDMIKLIRDAMNKQGINDVEARTIEERMMTADAKKWVESGVYGGSIDERNGATPLHVAAVKGYIEVMKLLLQSGAPIDAMDHEGWTPLHGAAHWGQVEACQLLADNYCNMKAINNQGNTALDVADSEVTSLLEELQQKQSHNDKMKIIRVTSKGRKSSITRISLGQKKDLQRKNEEDEKMAMGSVEDDDDDEDDVSATTENKDVVAISNSDEDATTSPTETVIKNPLKIDTVTTTSFTAATTGSSSNTINTVTSVTTATTVATVAATATTTTAAVTVATTTTTAAVATNSTATIASNIKERTKFEFLRNLQEKLADQRENVKSKTAIPGKPEDVGKTQRSIPEMENSDGGNVVARESSDFGVVMRRSIIRERADIEAKRPPNLASDIIRRSDNPALWRLGFRRPSNSENNSDIDQVIKLTEAERMKKNVDDPSRSDEKPYAESQTAPPPPPPPSNSAPSPSPTTTALITTSPLTPIATIAMTTTTTSTTTITHGHGVVDSNVVVDDDVSSGMVGSPSTMSHQTGSLLRPETAAALASIANSHQRISDTTKRDDANELERKLKAKRARESRRSTQGVTKEDIQKAEDSLKAAYKDPSSLQQQQLTSPTTTTTAESVATAMTAAPVAMTTTLNRNLPISMDGDSHLNNKLATFATTTATTTTTTTTNTTNTSHSGTNIFTVTTTATSKGTDFTTTTVTVVSNGGSNSDKTGIADNNNERSQKDKIIDGNTTMTMKKTADSEADDVTKEPEDDSSIRLASSRARRKRDSRRPTGKIALEEVSPTDTDTATEGSTTPIEQTISQQILQQQQRSSNMLHSSRNIFLTSATTPPVNVDSIDFSTSITSTATPTTTSSATTTATTTATTMTTSTTSALLRQSLKQLSDSYNITTTTTATPTTTITTTSTPMSRYSALFQHQQQQQHYTLPTSPRKFTPSTRWSTLNTTTQQQQKPQQNFATSSSMATATTTTITMNTTATRPLSHLTTFDSFHGNASKFSTSGTYAGNNSAVDYHKLWLEEKATNESLRKDLQNTRTLLDAANSQLASSVTTNEVFNAEAREKRMYERKIAELEEKLKDYQSLEKRVASQEDDLKLMENLRSENQKLKNENGALIRVISKLSK